MSVDTEWYLEVHSFVQATPWLHAWLAAYAHWAGLGLLALLLITGWWFHARHRGTEAPRAVATTVLTGVATVVSVLANKQLIAPIIARDRPCRTLAHLQTLLPCDAGFSMPSDHALLAGAFAAGLLILNRKLGVTALLLALLVAFGRVYAGVHYPADTLVGLLAGAAIATALVLALRRPTTALMLHLTRTPLRPLITTPREVTGSGSSSFDRSHPSEK